MAVRRTIQFFNVAGAKPDDVSVRAWHEALRAGWWAVGMYHDQVIQPRKFQADAAGRYGFQPRSERYVASKRRAMAKTWRVKSDLDLIHSGVTRTAVLQQQYPRAFPTRVTLSIPVREYVQMRPNKTGRPNLGEEIMRVNADDERQMLALFKLTVAARLQQWRGGRR
jgi:hypothetical protein